MEEGGGCVVSRRRIGDFRICLTRETYQVYECERRSGHETGDMREEKSYLKTCCSVLLRECFVWRGYGGGHGLLFIEYEWCNVGDERYERWRSVVGVVECCSGEGVELRFIGNDGDHWHG